MCRAAGIVSAKALRHECAWCAERDGKEAGGARAE